MPHPTAEKPASATDPRDKLLMEASLIIASFRWKLQRAGYPFAEPPNVTKIIAEIDKAVFPVFESAKR